MVGEAGGLGAVAVLPVTVPGDGWGRRAAASLRGIPGLNVMEPMDAVAMTTRSMPGGVVLLIAPEADAQGLGGLTDTVRESVRGSASMALWVSDADYALYREAMRLGYRELFTVEDMGDAAGVAGRLSRIAAGVAEAGASQGAHVTAVVAGKGGQGRTTMAVNVAVRLAATGKRVALLDFDIGTGACGLLLDMNPGLHAYDAIRAAQGGGVAALDDHMERYTRLPGRGCLDLLASPGRPELSDRLAEDGNLKEEHVSSMLSALAESYDFVIVDTPSGYPKQTLAALDACDTVLVPCTGDIPAVRNTKVCLDILSNLGVPRDRVRLLHNRGTERVVIGRAEMESALGYRVHATVPSDPMSLLRAVNGGVPVVLSSPGSRVSKALAELARGMADGKGGGRGVAELKARS